MSETTTPNTTETTTTTTSTAPAATSAPAANEASAAAPASTSQTSSEVPPTQTPSSETPPAASTETPPASAPAEEMDYDLELPKDSLMSVSDLEEIAKIAEKDNLTKSQAEELIKSREDLLKKGYTAFESQIKAQMDADLKALQSDPAFATKEAFDESMVHINRVVNAFGDEALIKDLQTGIGNKVAVARFLRKLGEAMAPEQSPAGKGAGQQAGNADPEAARLQRLYPSMK